jgi:hypothetical protein
LITIFSGLRTILIELVFESCRKLPIPSICPCSDFTAAKTSSLGIGMSVIRCATGRTVRTTVRWMGKMREK